MAFGLGSADTIKCPGCAANLRFSIEINKLVCNHCGGIYEPKSLIPSGSLNPRDQGDASDNDNQEIVCNSCGAVVITDNETSATTCQFCGSPAISNRRLSKEFKPDYIIPFKVNKEQAVKNFLEWVADKKHAPKKFKSVKNAENLRPIYVPFWLLDANCHCKFEGTGYLREGYSTEQVMFAIDRSVSFYMSRVPFDGSKKINDRLMEAIEPYDYDDMVEFNPGYLPGYFAQRYDITAVDMLPRIMRRFSAYGRDVSKHVVASEEHYDEIIINRDKSWAGEFAQSYALLPVWFMRYQYNGEKYDVVINGQTGEVAGYAPINKTVATLSKYGATPWIIGTIAFFILTFILLMAWPFITTNNLTDGQKVKLLLEYMKTLIPIVIIGGSVISGGIYKFVETVIKDVYEKLTNTDDIDKMPDVYEYFNTRKKVEIEKGEQKDQIIGIVHRNNGYDV